MHAHIFPPPKQVANTWDSVKQGQKQTNKPNNDKKKPQTKMIWLKPRQAPHALLLPISRALPSAQVTQAERCSNPKLQAPFFPAESSSR